MINFLGYRRPGFISLQVALKSIYGISNTTTSSITAELGLLPTGPISTLKEAHLLQLKNIMRLIPHGERLKIQESQRLRKGLEAREVRFVRARSGFPAHGQRTSCNAKTARRINSLRFK